jgi:hypothetical protein
VETFAVATAVADAIWTYGGEPWSALAIGGSCGQELCTLEVAGSRTGSMGEDLWVFDVAPATSRVTVVASTLHAIPADVPGSLHEQVMGLLGADRFRGLVLASVRWLPPPDATSFVLTYRSGGEEGSCGTDITVASDVPEITADHAQC